MSQALRGRRALITGSTVRTGLAIARAYEAAGAHVILHARQDSEAARSAQASIPDAELLFGDLTDPEACAQLAADCAELGGIDALVNNVGVYAPTDLAETDAAHWRWTMAGNLDSSFTTTQALLPQLLASGRGRIIMLGFVGCDRLRATGQATAYQIAKTGVHLLARSYGLRFAHRGLTANTISPGQLENSIDLTEAGPLPMGRPASAAELAAAAVFMASDQASYINGANIDISGGWRPSRERYED